MGALAATLFCALFISNFGLPAVVLGFQFLLMGRLRVIKDGSCSSCGLIPYVVIRILFITAVLMVAINFYCLHFVDHGLLESGVVNLKIPYITVLIVAPVTFIVKAQWHISATIHCRCALNVMRVSAGRMSAASLAISSPARTFPIAHAYACLSDYYRLCVDILFLALLKCQLQFSRFVLFTYGFL